MEKCINWLYLLAKPADVHNVGPRKWLFCCYNKSMGAVRFLYVLGVLCFLFLSTGAIIAWDITGDGALLRFIDNWRRIYGSRAKKPVLDC